MKEAEEVPRAGPRHNLVRHNQLSNSWTCGYTALRLVHVTTSHELDLRGLWKEGSNSLSYSPDHDGVVVGAENLLDFAVEWGHTAVATNCGGSGRVQGGSLAS